MRVTINQIEYMLPERATLEHALATLKAQPPFAVAINLEFIPKSNYGQCALAENDQIEVISPVTGG
jgi:sulfur carrier protein